MKTSLFCPLQPRTSWLMLVADGGWGMLPITMYARTKWLTKLAVLPTLMGNIALIFETQSSQKNTYFPPCNKGHLVVYKGGNCLYAKNSAACQVE